MFFSMSFLHQLCILEMLLMVLVQWAAYLFLSLFDQKYCGGISVFYHKP